MNDQILDYIRTYVIDHNDKLCFDIIKDDDGFAGNDYDIQWQIEIESTCVDTASLIFCLDARSNIRMLEYDEDTDYYGDDDQVNEFRALTETMLDNIAKLYGATSVKRQFIEALNESFNPIVDDPRKDA